MRVCTTMFLAFFVFLVAYSAMAQSHDAFTIANSDPVKSAKIYPNPATDYLNIKFETPIAKTIKVTLHSIIGNNIEVENEVVDEYEIRLKVKDLPTGYYLIALKDEGDTRSTVKFLKL